MLKHTKEIKAFLSRAEEISRTATKTLDTPIEKLSDISLENISGGGVGTGVAFWGGISVAGASAITAIGSYIAALHFSAKAMETQAQGDKAKSEKYSKVSQNLLTTSKVSYAPFIVGICSAGGALIYFSHTH